jgi:mono/diheme cytochrome c family protein
MVSDSAWQSTFQPPQFRTVRSTAALAICLPSALLAPSVSAQGAADMGGALAQRLCAYCHMAAGQGEKAGPDSIPGFAAIARRPGQTEAAIVRWLVSKPQAMPDHNLTVREASDLAAFIMTLAPPTQQR